MSIQTFASVDRYVRELFIGNDIGAGVIEENNNANGIPAWNISANQGRMLQILAMLNRPRRILEIGTQAGYSTYWLARALPDDGQLITLELNPEYAAVAAANMTQVGLGDIVEIRIGRAIDLLEAMIADNAAPFDMIFIDADKPPYAEYLECAIRLSRPGTLIIADNVVREGKVLDEDVVDAAVSGVQRFNRKLASDTRVTATIFQTIGVKDHDGMAIAIVK